MMKCCFNDLIFLLEVLSGSMISTVVSGSLILLAVFWLSKTNRRAQIKKYYQMRHDS
jgi:uncharacterized membrane protein